MLTVLAVVAVAAVVIWFVNGKYTSEVSNPVLNLTTKVKTSTKDILDVNNDTKINSEDVKAAVTKDNQSATVAKKAPKKVVAKVKKPKSKKPKA